MAIQPLNNGVPLLEQRTKINAAIGALNTATNPTAVTADAAFLATDAGGIFANSTATNHSKSLIPGLGHVLLVQNSTGTLTATQGTATGLSGSVATTATQPAVLLVEVSAGVYQGIAFAPNNLGTAAAQPTSAFATAAQGAKADTALQSVSSTTISDASTVGKALLTAASAGAAKATLSIAAGDVSGLAASATTDTTNASNINSGVLSKSRLPALNTTDITGLGTAATHAATDFAPAGTGTGGAVTAADVGLSNVNNTSDASKPVSTAQAAALALKSNIAAVGVNANATLTVGGKYTNIGSSDYSLTVPAGLGTIELVRGATNNLIAVAGSGVTISGAYKTSTAQERVVLTEFASGVYRGSASLSTVFPGVNLAKRHRLTKGPRMGRTNTLAITADHTTHVQTVLEAPYEVIRIGILNTVNQPLTNVRAMIGSAATLGANNSSTSIASGLPLTNVTFPQTKALTFTGAIAGAATGTLTANWVDPTGSYIITFSDGTQKVGSFTSGSTTVTWTGNVTATANATVSGSFRFGTVSSGNLLPVSHQSTNASITWSDWISLPSQDRTDGGTLPVIHVRIEVPYNSGANPTIPVYYTNDSTVAGWENEGTAINQGDAANAAPYRRPYRMRTQSVLGISGGSFTSTTLSFAGIPFVIQYITKNQVEGLTIGQVGDSIDEGLSSGGLKSNGWMLRAQRDLSTPTRPIEHIDLCFPGGSSGFFTDRALYLMASATADLLPEVLIMPIGSPNDMHSVTSVTFTASLSAATSGTLTAAWGGTTGTYALYFSDNSTQNVTLTNGSTAVSWTNPVTATAAALATNWNTDLLSMRFSRAMTTAALSTVDILPVWRTILPNSLYTLGNSDIARRNYNADLTNRPASSKSLTWDPTSIVSAGIDGTGQEQLNQTLADTLHPNDTGNELMSADLQAKIILPLLQTLASVK